MGEEWEEWEEGKEGEEGEEGEEEEEEKEEEEEENRGHWQHVSTPYMANDVLSDLSFLLGEWPAPCDLVLSLFVMVSRHC